MAWTTRWRRREENLVVKCDHMEQSYQCTLRNKITHRIQIRYVGLRRLVVCSVFAALVAVCDFGHWCHRVTISTVDKSKVKVSPFACVVEIL